MSALTDAQARLTNYLRAESAILTGAQAYSIGDRTLTKANLAEIRKGINDCRAEVNRLTTGSSGARVMRVVPRDL
jgi:hypothetical protein